MLLAGIMLVFSLSVTRQLLLVKMIDTGRDLNKANMPHEWDFSRPALKPNKDIDFPIR